MTNRRSLTNFRKATAQHSTAQHNDKPLIPNFRSITIQAENGAAFFLPGALVETGEGEGRFVPGHLLGGGSGTDPEETLRFLAGRTSTDGVFVPGHEIEGTFVEGQTVGGTTTFLPGALVEDPDTGKTVFVPGMYDKEDR